jgi:hypothetical protein
MTSTAMYVYELSGNIGDADAYLLNDFVHMIELGSKHVAIGALANITNGGQNNTFVAVLNAWRTTVGRQYSLGTSALNYTLRNDAPYVSGLYVSWGVDGSGVSEARVDFMLNASGKGIEMRFPYYVNVSTRLFVEGFLTEIAPGSKQATVICRLSNEGQPALANNITIHYRESTLWFEATNNYVITDYGNGTYRATFMVETSATVLDVSARVFDLRSVLVQANATCLQQ